MQESSKGLTDLANTLETPQPTIEQYQRLWLHVLRRTVEDADEGKPKAIEYLTTPNEGLEYVCELAGVERKAVLERSRERYLDIGAPALAAKQAPARRRLRLQGLAKQKLTYLFPRHKQK